MKTLFLATAIVAAAWDHAAAGTLCSIATDDVNARKGPGTHYDIVFRAGRGYPIKAERLLGDWVRFEDWEGDHAWIARRLLSGTPTAVILGNDVNARRDAAQSAAVLGKVGRGEIYKVLRERNGWVQLSHYDTDEKIGWVRKDLTWGECR